MKTIKSFILLFTTIFVVGCSGKGKNDEPPLIPGEPIVIYATSDVHCAIDDNLGYATLATYIKREQKRNKYVTLVDAGDAIQGNLIGSLSKGEYIVDIMNNLNYDMYVVGNHEFDYGIDVLKDRINQFNGDMLSCNISYTGTNENKIKNIKPYSIITYGNNKKVGYIGVTTPTTLVESSPKYFKEDDKVVYDFGGENYYKIVQNNIDECRSLGCDYVVLLTHLGYSDNYSPYSSPELIASISGIDALIDGHSHQIVNTTYIKDKTGKDIPMCTPGYQMNAIARLALMNGEVHMELLDKGIDKDVPTLDLVNEIKNKVSEEANKPICHSDCSLLMTDENGIRMTRNRETGIGNLLTDSFRNFASSQIGIINGGGIRDSLYEGDITFGDIKKIQPFDNTIVSVKASGQTILDYLEFTSMYTQHEYTDGTIALGENGSFAHVSGLKYTIDTSIPTSVRITESGDFISVDGERRVKDVKVLDNDSYISIDPNSLYTVSGLDFILLDGGGGASMFKGSEVVSPDLCLDSDALTTYLVDILDGHVKDLYEHPEGRITVL